MARARKRADDPGGHEKARETHRRAAELHERAAELHEASAHIHEKHAAEMAGVPDRVKRAQRIAGKEREAAAREHEVADHDRGAARGQAEQGDAAPPG